MAQQIVVSRRRVCERERAAIGCMELAEGKAALLAGEPGCIDLARSGAGSPVTVIVTPSFQRAASRQVSVPVACAMLTPARGVSALACTVADG